MRLVPRSAWIAVAVVSGVAAAGQLRPAPVLPESLGWASPPGIPAVAVAWLLGAERDAGPYVVRVRLAAGGRIPPHAHPDARHTTVLSGTLYVGFGREFDERELVAAPAGAVYVAPANVPHFLLAKDGEVVYQESGVGPTGTVLEARN
jgi:quercetin dioxygenase-like cupin family protein